MPKEDETMLPIILMTTTSITSIVTQNCLHNTVCKKHLTTPRLIALFNLPVYIVSALIFAFFMFLEGVSLFTVLLGIVFGVVTALANIYKMRALSSGPMHLTLLITTSSMLIPTMSGVFFGEAFSFYKLLAAIVLIFFIYLSLGKNGNNKINVKWILFCLLAFLLQGTIGVLQKVHQSSEYKAETGGFLFVAFLISLVFTFVRVKGDLKGLSGKVTVFAIICGVCTFLMNDINLKLSGMLPSQLFFPLVNGSAIVLSSAMSIVLFKEKLTAKQYIGLGGGILTLIAICLVP